MNNKGAGTAFTVLLTMLVTILFCFIAFRLWFFYELIDGKILLPESSSANSGETIDISNNENGSKPIPDSMQNKINKLKKLIDDTYLYDYDEEKMADLLATGMLVSIKDDYAQYYSKEDFSSLMSQTTGEYYGIGVYVTYDSNRNMPIVIMPIEGSPAEEAGLQTADYIEYVDDLKAENATYTEMVEAIRGLPYTKVKLGIIRFKDDTFTDYDRLEVEVQRKNIELNPVKSKIIDNSIGYIRLTSFDEITYDQFKEEYIKLMQNQNVKSLIIDLRDNPGGIYDVCVKIADLIVPAGKIVYTLDKQGNEKASYSDDVKVELPLVVLANENSASASEVFLGAVKDYGVGTIIGKKTYGKGVVQTLRPLGDGSYVKFTTEEYFSPNGNKINSEGVSPDIEVDLPEGIKSTYKLEFEKDTQLQKAIEVLHEKEK